MNEIVLDIETIPSQLEWVQDHVRSKTKPPGTIKKQESIDKWYQESFTEAFEENLSKTTFDGATNHIICLSLAFNNEDPVSFRADKVEDEAKLLSDFYKIVVAKSSQMGRKFIGHNITGFDMKIIKQRSMILGVIPPAGIPFSAKPWDLNPFDTMTQWDGKSFTSMDTIAKALGIKGKEGMDGSMVYESWKAGEYQKIQDYCESDVIMAREIYKKMKGFFQC